MTAVGRSGLAALSLLDCATNKVVTWAGDDDALSWAHATWWTSEEQARSELARAVKAGYLQEVERGRYHRTSAPLPEAPTPAPRPPRTVDAGPACWGECGRWRKPTAAQRAVGVYARGPTTEVIDAEGRRYAAELQLVDARTLRTSHDPRTFAVVADYPAELQARQRADSVSRLQVEALARNLDSLLLVAPSSSPADGPPIVWGGAVVSGNGRTMAYLRAAGGRTPESYELAVRRRWRARVLDEALSAEAPLMVVRTLEGSTPHAAVVQLAGASQTCPTAELSRLERSLSRARSAGIVDPLALGPFEWTDPINVATFEGFRARNGRWWQAAQSLAGPARRSVLDDPERGAQWAVDLLVGGLPPEVLAGGLGDPPAAEALVGALPCIWSLEYWARTDRIKPQWRLLPVLGQAKTWIGRAGSKTIARLAVDVDADLRHVGSTVPDEGVEDHGQAELAVGLAVALIRAGRRADPETAASEYLTRYATAAREDDPRQAGLLGPIEGPEPAAVLSKIVAFRFRRRPNPCGCACGDTGNYLEFGWRVGFDLVGLGRYELPGDWSLLCRVEGNGRPAGPALLGHRTEAARPRGPAADAWAQWSGELASTAASFQVPGPEDGPGRELGEVRAVYYRSIRERRTVDFKHKFEGRLPVLVELPVGWWLNPRGSRHRVTQRGIVG